MNDDSVSDIESKTKENDGTRIKMEISSWFRYDTFDGVKQKPLTLCSQNITFSNV